MNELSLPRVDPHSKESELEVQKIIHSYVSIIVRHICWPERVTISHIPATNAPNKYVLEGQPQDAMCLKNAWSVID